MSEHATQEAAAKAVLAWWRTAGVEPLGPVPSPPARAPRPVAASSSAAARSFTERVRPGAPARKPSTKPRGPAPTPPAARDDATQSARGVAAACGTLEQLKAAINSFTDHPLRAGARNTVFARGAPDAPVMIVGEGPGREEDQQGLPFVGRSGQLLDAMFAAVGMTDAAELYITNIVNWRPPGNRNPNAQEVALSLPFIERHIALKRPKLLVLAGGVAAQALLRAEQGIMRLRGRWSGYRVKDGEGEHTDVVIPALPIYHPAFLLRRAVSKREAWRDLLALEKRLAELS